MFEKNTGIKESINYIYMLQQRLKNGVCWVKKETVLSYLHGWKQTRMEYQEVALGFTIIPKTPWIEYSHLTDH